MHDVGRQRHATQDNPIFGKSGTGEGPDAGGGTTAPAGIGRPGHNCTGELDDEAGNGRRATERRNRSIRDLVRVEQY